MLYDNIIYDNCNYNMSLRSYINTRTGKLIMKLKFIISSICKFN